MTDALVGLRSAAAAFRAARPPIAAARADVLFAAPGAAALRVRVRRGWPEAFDVGPGPADVEVRAAADRLTRYLLGDAALIELAYEGELSGRLGGLSTVTGVFEVRAWRQCIERHGPGPEALRSLFAGAGAPRSPDPRFSAANGRWVTVSNATPFCPTCGSSLVLTRQGEFHPWVCPNGHGLAATTSEAYVRAQEDELDQLWKLAKQAAPGTRKCPMCEQLMVVVDLPWDSDEAVEGAPGDGPDEGHELLDVCVRDEVVWFDAGELELLPADLPDPEPTAEELAKIEQIADTFATAEIDAERDALDHTITGELTNLVLRHSKAAQHFVNRRAAEVERTMSEADQSV